MNVAKVLLLSVISDMMSNVNIVIAWMVECFLRITSK